MNFTTDQIFYIKIALTFVGAGLIWTYMEYEQRKKEKAARKQFERVLQMIELKNRKYGDNNEPKE